MNMRVLSYNLKTIDHVGDLGLYESIILKLFYTNKFLGFF
jgi:hypothetical protein